MNVFGTLSALIFGMATPKRATLRDALEISEYTYREQVLHFDNGEMRIEEVAVVMGISRREAIRLEVSALNKMRVALKKLIDRG